MAPRPGVIVNRDVYFRFVIHNTGDVPLANLTLS